MSSIIADDDPSKHKPYPAHQNEEIAATNPEIITTEGLLAQNALNVPLLRLPYELICTILALSAFDQYVGDWMKLGHVCSFMRGVLLSMYELWGGTVSTWEERRERLDFLAREGPGSPLTLIAHPSTNLDESLTNNIQRARSLTATQNITFLEWFINHDHTNFRFLEELSLAVPLFMMVPVPSMRQQCIRTPRLRNVTLIDVNCLFSATSLTNLHIEYRRQPRSHYTASQLLDILRGCANLRELTLRGCLPFIVDPPDDLIHLPSLISFSLDDQREYALQLWYSVRIPTTAKVDMTYICQPTVQEYTGPAIFGDLAHLREHLEEQRPSAFSVALADETLTLIFKTSNLTRLQVTYRNLPNEAEMTWINTRGDAMRRICNDLRVGLREVRIIMWMDDAHDPPAGLQHQWAGMLQNFPNLERLDMEKMSGSMCAALASLASESQETHLNDAQVIMPRLGGITMRATTVHGIGDQEGVWTIAAFAEMLERRAARGSPLNSLVVYGLNGISYDMFVSQISSRFPRLRIDGFGE